MVDRKGTFAEHGVHRQSEPCCGFKSKHRTNLGINLAQARKSENPDMGDPSLPVFNFVSRDALQRLKSVDSPQMHDPDKHSLESGTSNNCVAFTHILA